VNVRIETLAIGDELLDGRLADTNSKHLGDVLAQRGLTVSRSTVVCDDVELIAEAVREAAGRADLLITSGGLGPTTDDLTADGIARAAGTGTRFDEGAWADIQRRFEDRGLSLPDTNRRQAEVPADATILENAVGTAPAFLTEVGGARVFSFPGVPREYRHLVEAHLEPALGEAQAVRERRTIRCLGITESQLGKVMEPFEAAHPEVIVQYRTSFPENHVRLVVTDAGADVDALVAEARAGIGGAAYAVGERKLEELLLDELKARGLTIATAESCTGGLIGKRLTDIAGSSAAVMGGVISYANEVKVGQLDVEQGDLDAHGAVSEPVALQMARGARDNLGADIAISTTGVAGPGGGTEDKPVGTVWFGLSSPRGTFAKRRFLPFGDRGMIRQLAASVALRWALKELGEL
jgi:nicotinamide-nucleotide amidase